MKKIFYLFTALFMSLSVLAQERSLMHENFPFPQSVDVIDESGTAYYTESMSKNLSITVDGGGVYWAKEVSPMAGLGLMKFWSPAFASEVRVNYINLDHQHLFTPELRGYIDLLQLAGYKNFEESRFWRIMPGLGMGYTLLMENGHKPIHGVDAVAGIRFQRQFNHILGAFIEPDVRFVPFGSKDIDFLPSVRVGLSFNLSGWDAGFRRAKIYSQMEIDDLNMAIGELQEEARGLKDQIKVLEKRPVNCPEVLPEPKVFANGEGLKTVVYFSIGRSTIDPREEVALETVAGFVKDNGVDVVVKGYADALTGTTEINQRLSEDRAEAVTEYLVRSGVSREKIKIKAYGDLEQPYAKNEWNRIVLIEIPM